MKQGAPLKRGKPMSRGTGFTRPERERAPQPLYQLARPCRAAVIETASVPVHKPETVRSEPYRRLVASLPCLLCGIEGFTQHAHGNLGKGLALKTDDRFAFPLCADRPGTRGCHSKLDQGALFSKSARRDIETEWARRTALYLIGAGLWPQDVPVPEWAE